METNRKWFVYVLLRNNGKEFYVGRTVVPKRRLGVHRKRFGADITMRIVQEGYGPKKQASDAEIVWICKLLDSGIELLNSMKGSQGAWDCRGQKKNWTPAGLRQRKKTQFKRGHYRFADLTPEQQEARRGFSRKQWENISPEERSRKATERNLGAWKKTTSKQRAARGKAIRQGQLAKIPAERRSELASKAAKILLADPKARKNISKSVKGWWATLTSKAKKDFIARRAVKIAEAKAAKKLIASV